MRLRCIQNSLLPVPIEYILAQRTLRPAEAVVNPNTNLLIRQGGGAAPRWDKCEWDWSYLPEIAGWAIRERAVTQGSTTAQSLFNYERTGYTGPNCSRRDLPSTLLLRGWMRDGEGYFALRVYHHPRYGRAP